MENQKGDIVSKDIKIYDNFLEENDFYNIRSIMSAPSFPWFFTRVLMENEEDMICEEKDNYHFSNVFYMDGFPVGNNTDIVAPILYKIKPAAIIRIKANLTTRTEKVILHGYHNDVNFKCKTAVYYLNTNDGFTAFEDGQVVESVENRMVIFDSDILHTGSTCTNAKYRMLINFNYIG